MSFRLSQVRALMQRHGLRRLYGKVLATNDNSKQQIYLGRSYGVLQGLPFEVRALDTPTGRPAFYGWPRFFWMNDDGALAAAPDAKLILYPQYPEVRLSGVLRGAAFAPDSLRQRVDRSYPERCLLLGITDDGRILGYVAAAPDPLVNEITTALGASAKAILSELPIDDAGAPRAELLHRLKEIHAMGWITGRKLTSVGTVAYNARNGGGYTLEALFGISANGLSEPDFKGWELKQHAGSVITLLTPEPTSGFYQERGPEAFVRRYGYPDKNGEEDRLNFGGTYRLGVRSPLTQLTLHFDGFDVASGKLMPGGGLVLLDPEDRVAARWGFSTLLTHWARKHASAAYVPSESTYVDGLRVYRYGADVQLGEGTDFLLFLRAIAFGHIYLDPLTSVKRASSAKPEVHRRSQFRVRTSGLAALYREFATVNVSAP